MVTTIFPLADWTRQVGGDRVKVTNLLPTGASPHTFEPTPREMRQVADSKVFFTAGLRMDDWGAKLGRASKGTKTVKVGDVLAADKALPDVDHVLSGTEELGSDEAHEALQDGHDHHHHHHDDAGANPHFWLDPQVAKHAVDKIAQELAAIDPQSADYYTSNALAYKQQLDALDAESSNALAGCAGKGFVSFHNAYPYLANRYGLTIAAVIEEYPGKTPSDKYVKNVADRLRELQVNTVFSEPQLNPRVAEVLAAEVGAKVDVLDPYGSEGVSERDSYLNLVRYNVGKLKQALCP